MKLCGPSPVRACVAVGVLALLAGGPPGCAGGDPDGPPEIRLGRDQCAECGMIINEDRCSCASRIDAGRGAEVALFDDIGCLLEHERQNPDSKVVHRFVHDYATKAWVNAEAATFLWAESLRTPMGSGIAAFATREAAENARQEHAGDLHGFADLRTARDKWMEEQFGSPQK